MQAAEAHELRFFQAGNRAENTPLFGVGHLGLKSDQPPQCSGPVVLPQLNNRMRAGAATRVGQADRFHRTVGQGVFAAPGHFLNRQTTLEVATLLERLFRDLFRGQNVVNEAVILGLREGTVEIIIAAVVVARGPKRHVRIY